MALKHFGEISLWSPPKCLKLNYFSVPSALFSFCHCSHVVEVYCVTLKQFKSLVKKLAHLRIKNKSERECLNITRLVTLYVLQSSLISFSFVAGISDLRRGFLLHRVSLQTFLFPRVNSRSELLRLLVKQADLRNASGPSFIKLQACNTGLQYKRRLHFDQRNIPRDTIFANI